MKTNKNNHLNEHNHFLTNLIKLRKAKKHPNTEQNIENENNISIHNFEKNSLII